MRLLLDTHALLWFLEGDKKLSKHARMLIEDAKNDVFVSILSFFEITIKFRLDKIRLIKPLTEIYQDTLAAEIQILPITYAHILAYQEVPLIDSHRDPFDRQLIAIAYEEVDRR